MTAWIKKVGGEIADDYVFAAYMGFSGSRTIKFFNKPERIHYKPYDIVVGDILDTRYIMEKLGVELPNFYIPDELLPFAGRTIEQTTVLEALRRKSKGESFFIKPVEIKQFPAQVVDKFPLMSYRDQEIKDFWKCWISDVVEFVSEYRVFIIEGEIVGCQYYEGNFSLFPDWGVIKEAVMEAKHPAGWCIDFGIDRRGKTFIIEVNDGYSIGNYGLWAPTYCKLLEKRWRELENGRKTIINR